MAFLKNLYPYCNIVAIDGNMSVKWMPCFLEVTVEFVYRLMKFDDTF